MENGSQATNGWDLLCYLASTPLGLIFLFLLATIFGGIIIGAIIKFIKSNNLKVDSKFIKLNMEEKTRSLIEEDLRYLKTRINSTFLKLPKAEDHSEDYRCRYCLKQIEDVFEDMIIFNNMSNDDDYIKSKQQILYATVIGLIVDCEYASYYESDEFRDKCNKFTEEVINQLVVNKKRFQKETR